MTDDVKVVFDQNGLDKLEAVKPISEFRYHIGDIVHIEGAGGVNMDGIITRVDKLLGRIYISCNDGTYTCVEEYPLQRWEIHLQ